jgi:hypothetical protein
MIKNDRFDFSEEKDVNAYNIKGLLIIDIN